MMISSKPSQMPRVSLDTTNTADNREKLTSGSVTKNVAHMRQVLPDDEGFDGTHFQSLEGVINAEAVLPTVLVDLVKVLLDQLLLLDEFDIGEGLRCEVNSLCRLISAQPSRFQK